jgi:uncharacterized protein YbjT (DUF2867 family)
MNIVIFGATGMIGQGVLRQCLRDPDVALVKAVGRSATGAEHPRLRDVVHRDVRDFSAIDPELRAIDACFFCLGVTSAGMTETDYERITYDIPVAAASTLVRLNPEMTFVLVSGAGADSTEQGRVMWARVKGKILYALTAVLMPLIRRVFRGYVVTTEDMGKAMLLVAKHGAPKRVLESPDISALVESRTAPSTKSS